MKIGENGISSNGFERKFRCDLASSSVKILVASTKSSNIAGILWAIPWVILGWVILWVIRKRLVGFRLDFLARDRVLQVWLTLGLVSWLFRIDQIVGSTKSSNIAGIPVPGLLGLIRKRLVEFRLDFLAFQN